MASFASFQPCLDKMKSAQCSAASIASFESSYNSLLSGATGIIPESTIEPASGLPDTSSLLPPGASGDPAHDPKILLSKTVMLKLNGGLGTGMGLDKAKSLLVVKDNDTFLDLTAKQVQHLRAKYGPVKFMLMNSFSTSADTMSFLAKNYPNLASDADLELLQNKVPKIDAKTFLPAAHSKADNEWCPPGHGDLYAALVGSGKLASLLASGYSYLFVSNADNLGATLDVPLLQHFAASGKPFLMECCVRTENDKKGGHLARRCSDGQLVLRESAMCAPEDEAAFQDVEKHKYFNTNNLWLRLDALDALVKACGGFVPLPVIMNRKTVDPRDAASASVLQLETAMGAAIECFEGAGAIVVPRERFAPVKKTDDLLLLRSDAYVVGEDSTLQLNAKCVGGQAPIISLDPKKYKFVQHLERALANGIPSFVNCTRLTIVGEVWLNRKCIFEGDVSLNNESDEPKLLPGVKYSNTKIDLTAASGLGPLKPTTVKTTPISGQAPGTSGLRKKTAVFMQPNYLENFVQSVLDATKAFGTDVGSGTLLIGGDGRYFNSQAIQTIIQMAVANGVRRIWVGQDGLLSTPAASAIIRERGPAYQKAFGAFILTASHNPGGPTEDFGIKYNCENGGPAQEFLTDAMLANTKGISEYHICKGLPKIDLGVVRNNRILSKDGACEINVEVISSTDVHINLLRSVFDFPAIKTLLSREDFKMVYDCMHGVNGPYARALFCGEFGLPVSAMMNSEPKDDFAGHHADPNLTYAKELVAVMGLDSKGNAIDMGGKPVPNFGAAADGDGDRNMILGDRFFVTPSDSLAIIAANASKIPFFSSQGGLKAVARSMPTSGAVDLVARALNLALFEVPTGWKFFGNLMDSKDLFGGIDYTPFICGEESFGTGSNHIREKDGLWAVLAWLNILAASQGRNRPLVTVQQIVTAHWKRFGRNHYQRYDYEGMDAEGAKAMMSSMIANQPSIVGKVFGPYTVATADVFTYNDPVDGSVSKNQGVRFLMRDGSRVIFRLSGTAGSGATVRMYLEKYVNDEEQIAKMSSDALVDLVPVALELCNIKKFCGTDVPTVIT